MVKFTGELCSLFSPIKTMKNDLNKVEKTLAVFISLVFNRGQYLVESPRCHRQSTHYKLIYSPLRKTWEREDILKVNLHSIIIMIKNKSLFLFFILLQ